VHAERCEQALVEHRGQRLAIQLLCNQAEENGVRIRIVVALPGREVRRNLEGGGEQFGLGPSLCGVGVEGSIHLERLGVVA
jgi:hypothetical protein